MSVKSEASVTIYELDMKAVPVGHPPLKLESHWNDNDMIVFRFPGSEPITVSVADLRDAIRRCSQ